MDKYIELCGYTIDMGFKLDGIRMEEIGVELCKK